MKIKKQWLIRIFILLFSVSVSVAVLPCGIINVHGLFGEITPTTITEDDKQLSYQKSHIFEKRKLSKGIYIFNIWFEIWICIMCMVLVKYMFKLPKEDTVITLKVRMDN